VKTCIQCKGKLGLGIRARNLWNGRWWSHVYFCSARCEDRYELEQSEANAGPRRRGFFARGGGAASSNHTHRAETLRSTRQLKCSRPNPV
jgi:hypothetical protein